jgi:hypothetical protein
MYVDLAASRDPPPMPELQVKLIEELESLKETHKPYLNIRNADVRVSTLSYQGGIQSTTSSSSSSSSAAAAGGGSSPITARSLRLSGLSSNQYMLTKEVYIWVNVIVSSTFSLLVCLLFLICSVLYCFFSFRFLWLCYIITL